MKTRAILFIALFCACAGGDDPAPGEGGLPRCEPGSETEEAPVVHPMSFTRLLRRVSLTLTGRTPSSEAYDAMAAATTDEARQALIDKTIDEALASTAFYRSMVAFGHDWISVGWYANGFNEGTYHGSQSANIEPCEGGTVHAGKWRVAGDENECDNSAIEVNAVEPWWALGTSIQVIGRAGTGVRGYTASDSSNIDCGLVEHGYWDNLFKDDPDNQCSCGPNLVYCHPYSGFANGTSHDPALAGMQVWEEPARFLAHVVWHDRPLTDLVLANYTVAPLRLRHLYVRHGRQNPDHKALDDDHSWYEGPFNAPADPEHQGSDPLAWNEVVVEKLQPDMLALTADKSASGSLDRTYAYDPRTTTEEIEGMPSAGVLTMAGSMASFARERVRAARFIEIFSCRQFVPPPGDVTFNEFDRDPATTGTCQHCHRTMDPAAIFFKRWSFRGSGTGGTFAVLGGVGPYRFTASSNLNYDPYERWVAQFLPDTVMTPVTQAQFEANPETLLIDFMPEGTLLFGEQGDGTVGPLGFGKILVTSGEFDQCVVRKLYERFVGRAIDTTTEMGYLEALRKVFVDGERKVRPFVRHILATEDFRRGL
jgi:hypothetical protein